MLLMMLIVLVNFLRMLSSMLIKMKRAELKYKAKKVCILHASYVVFYAHCSQVCLMFMFREMLKPKHKGRQKQKSRNDELMLGL